MTIEIVGVVSVYFTELFVCLYNTLSLLLLYALNRVVAFLPPLLVLFVVRCSSLLLCKPIQNYQANDDEPTRLLIVGTAGAMIVFCFRLCSGVCRRTFLPAIVRTRSF